MQGVLPSLRPAATTKTQWVLVFEKKWYDNLINWVKNDCPEADKSSFIHPSDANRQLMENESTLKTGLKYGHDFECCSESGEEWLKEQFGEFRRIIGCLILDPRRNIPTVILAQEGRNVNIRFNGRKFAKFAKDDWPVGPVLSQVCSALNIQMANTSFSLGTTELTDMKMRWGSFTQYDCITISESLPVLDEEPVSVLMERVRLACRQIDPYEVTEVQREEVKREQEQQVPGRRRKKIGTSPAADAPKNPELVRPQSRLVPPRTGFVNTGSNCFMNAVLQVLFRISEFTQRIRSDRENGEVTNELARLIDMFETPNSPPLNVDELREKIEYVGDVNLSGQQDAHEFLLKLQKCLDLEGTDINDIFNFSELQESSGVPEGRLQKSFCLQLSLSEEYKDLGQCIEAYQAKAGLPSSRFTKTMLREFGDILIIHLNRFTGNGQKNSQEIKIPDEYAGYVLFGVVNHYGTVNRGHYTSSVLVQGKWYYCNDTSVIHEYHARTEDAYLLFYKKSGA